MKRLIAKCPACGGLTAFAVADTAREELEALRDARVWRQRGDIVQLVDVPDWFAVRPAWCGLDLPCERSR